MNREQLKTVSDALHNGAEPGEVWEAIQGKATPIPWITHQRMPHAGDQVVYGHEGGTNICRVYGTALSTDPNHPLNQTAKANAELICRAVNAHDELVAVIKATLPRFCELLNYRERYEGKAWAQDFYEVQTKLRAVIANAEKSL